MPDNDKKEISKQIYKNIALIGFILSDSQYMQSTAIKLMQDLTKQISTQLDELKQIAEREWEKNED